MKDNKSMAYWEAVWGVYAYGAAMGTTKIPSEVWAYYCRRAYMHYYYEWMKS